MPATRLTALALAAGLVGVATSAFAADDGKASKAIVEAFKGAATEKTVEIDNSAYAAILSKHVAETPSGLNTFDYAAMSDAERQSLKGYIDSLTAMDPTKLTRAQKIAYWSNLYNAVTIDVVADHMPIDSIKEIELRDTGQKIEDEGFFTAVAQVFTDDGPWEAPLVTVNGTTLTLNNIEHLILRKMDEPRIHYSINCASYGCPDLRKVPWVAASLDADLDEAAREYINHPRGVRQDENGKLIASSIYNWFKKDFGGTNAGVIEHMRPFADEKTAVALEANNIDEFEYDWTLNSPQKVKEIEAGG